MKNILDTIIATKREEIEILLQKGNAYFESQPYFNRTCISLQQKIKNSNEIHLITEFKRKSPSKGNINLTTNITDIVTTYQKHGASAISILTDQQYFGGNNEDVVSMRPVLTVPILRKEFIIHEIQIVEAKALGADVILLIAACLSPAEVQRLAVFAKSLGLEVLLELHSETELKHVCNEVNFVGINNRNLKNFSVSIEHSIAMREKIGSDFIAVAESGIQSRADVELLYQQGFDAFLIGEYLMKQDNIGATIDNLKSITND